MTALIANDIFTRVQRIFGDESSVQVLSTDILAWINDAQREIVMQHEGLLSKSSLISSVSGTNTYNLPADLLSLQQVEYKDSVSGVFYDLRFLSAEGLDQLLPDWSTSSGTPVFYSRGADQGILLLTPTPDVSVANNIRLTYSRYSVDVTALTGVGSALDVPEYYHQTILEYCLMKSYEMDENWEATDRKSDYVQSTIDFNNGREGWFGHETYPTVTTTAEDYF